MQRTYARFGLALSLWCAGCGAEDDPQVAVPMSDAGSAAQVPPRVTDDASAALADALSTPVPPAVAQSDASTTGTACQVQVVDPVRTIPDMLIVLDRSGSMNADQNDQGTDRWGGSRSALIEVTAAFDDRVSFGLMTYPGGPAAQRNRDECSAGMLDVPVSQDAGDAIRAALAPMNAGGRTPTSATLRRALDALGGVSTGPDQTGAAKYVLLVTDGDPNCSGDTRGGVDQAARMQSIAAIEALRMAGIKTFVVGYETQGSDFAAQLDAMAAVGGTGAMMHRSVSSGADLSATIAEIAGQVASCTYALAEPVKNPTHVLVEVAGQKRDRGNDADGFQLEADQRTINLLGKACEDVRAGKLLKMTVTCQEVIPG